MSKGYFFELNQRLSAIENGIAIFDYTELPADEGYNMDNPLMVRYPISVNINADAVCFKLHYCTYHYINVNDKPIDYHQNLETSAIDQGNWGLTHVEDVILELPFAEKATSRPSSVIKNSYNTEFPLKYSTKENLKGYLEHLIRDQFKIKKQTDKSQVPERPLDVFYSSQWLMDIYDDSKDVNLYENNDPKLVITKFLRKLILDFMFDLKHSDVFQSSANFQKMFTGLMSDFYFSSLMHKCEFYYYRDLIFRQVELIKDGNKERFTYLYAKELFDAQALWTNDIMNPLSESYFEHDFPNLKVLLSSYIICEKLNDKKWNSWFATPEEEMRRVYFTMNEWGKSCNCNAETLSEFLDLNKKDDNVIKASLVSMRENRERISRWFLSRYDFNDVLHLHFFRFSNIVFFFLILLFVGFLWGLWGDYKCVGKVALYVISLIMNNSSFWFLFAALIIGIIIWFTKNRHSNRLKKNIETDVALQSAHKQLYSIKLMEMAIGLCVLIFLVIEVIKLYDSSICHIYFNICHLYGKRILFVSIGIILVLLFILEPLILKKIPKILLKLCSFFVLQMRRVARNMHIMLPKLFASITAAWLTLSTGYVIYISFYDVKVSPLVPIAITVIVICFIITRIARTMPTASAWLLFFRAFELFIISYCIAFVIGILAVNFVGERYLCHDDTFKELKNKITYQEKQSNKKDPIIEIEDTVQNKKLKASRQDMIKYYISTKDKNGNYEPYRLFAVNYYIPNTKTNKDTNAKPDQHELFIMPEFLIMFSFITMFIGIFLQMAFFDTRQMTDF